MLRKIKGVLTWLPIVGPYFERVFSVHKQTAHSGMNQISLRIVSDLDDEPPQTHADWAGEQVTTPSLKVAFPGRNTGEEILKIKRIAEKLGVDALDLESAISVLRRRKRLVLIEQKKEKEIDFHEFARELVDIVNPNDSVECTVFDQIIIQRQFQMFQSIADSLGQGLDVLINEYEIEIGGLRRSERPFDNGGVGLFIFQDELLLKRFRIGTFRMPLKFKVAGAD